MAAGTDPHVFALILSTSPKTSSVVFQSTIRLGTAGEGVFYSDNMDLALATRNSQGSRSAQGHDLLRASGSSLS